MADAFTPLYHVSGGEEPFTGFALFEDGTPQKVRQHLPPVPPVSHFRVQPLGFGTATDGTRLSVLRLDYLTLWNRDDGLDSGGACLFEAGIVGGLIGLNLAQLLQGLESHEFDNERSAALVAAPVTGPEFNLDPAAYKAYAYFTTAHEGGFFDQSTFIFPGEPVPAGNHIQLALSRSKHGTYAFNPDFLPMIPDWIIVITYDTINFLYAIGQIDVFQYLAYLFIADTLFFGCVVEQFEEQGGQFAATRTNVGEPGRPINQSRVHRRHRNAGGLRNKLTGNLFSFFQPEPPPPPQGLTFRASPAVERNADGRLATFAVGNDCAVYENFQLSPGGGWSGWRSLGGCIGGGVTGWGANADGRLELYVRGSDNSTPFRNWQTSPGGSWSGWHGLDGALSTDPVVYANADGRLEVFARGVDCSLYHAWQTSPGLGWSGWHTLGGCIGGGTSVARNFDGRLEVYVRGSDNSTPYRNWQTSPGGGWSGWHRMNSALTKPSSSNADGRLEVFARGVDCSLYHAWQTLPGQGWSGWHTLGGCIGGGASVARNFDGRLEVYVRGSDSATPNHNWQTAPGARSGWHGLDGVLTTDPVLGVNADGQARGVRARRGPHSVPRLADLPRAGLEWLAPSLTAANG